MQVHYSLYVQYDVFLYIEQIDYINISDTFLEGFCVPFKGYSLYQNDIQNIYINLIKGTHCTCKFVLN